MPGSTAEQSPTRRFAEREHANNPVAKAHAAKSNDFCGILQNEFKHFLDAPHWYAAPGSLLLVLSLAGWAARRWWLTRAKGRGA